MWILGILFVLSTIGVSASRCEIDCDRDWWDTDICRDFELQEEFGCVENYIASVDYNSRMTDIMQDARMNGIELRSIARDIDIEYQSIKRDERLNNKIMRLISNVEDYSDKNDRRIIAISNQGDKDVKDYSDKNDRRVVNYVNDQTQSAKNYADANDRRGTTFKRVHAFLFDEFLAFIDNLFVTHDEHEAAILMTQGDCAYAMVKAHRLGETVKSGNTQYNPHDDLGCITFGR